MLSYTMPDGDQNVYLVQSPAQITTNAAIIIYMHGAMHDEKQGMNLFPSMRKILAAKGWILVSPRIYEYDGLLKDVTARFGNHKILLAGASAPAMENYFGGSWSLYAGGGRSL